jgi:hypothetical protein
MASDIPYVASMDPAYQQYGADRPSQEPPPGRAPSPDYPDAEPARRAPRIGRPGIIVLAAVLTEIVLVGALANQWMSEKIIRNSVNHGQSVRLAEASWLTYTWRGSPRHGQTDLWWSEILLLLTLFVLSALLVWAVVRGPVTFVRAFIGTWMAVIVATLLGAFVRGLIDPNNKAALPGANRLVRGAFGPSGPGQPAFWGSVLLGLVVGLITALIAIATRRRPGAAVPAGPPQFADYGPPPPAAAATGMPPWQDQHYGPPAPQSTPPEGVAPAREGRGEDDAGARTTQLPTLEQGEPGRGPDSGAEQTTQLPRMDEGERPGGAAGPAGAAGPVGPAGPAGPAAQAGEPGQRPAGPASGVGPTGPASGERPTGPASGVGGEQQATTRFPRPPDDDDLGHEEHP